MFGPNSCFPFGRTHPYYIYGSFFLGCAFMKRHVWILWPLHPYFLLVKHFENLLFHPMASSPATSSLHISYIHIMSILYPYCIHVIFMLYPYIKSTFHFIHIWHAHITSIGFKLTFWASSHWLPFGKIPWLWNITILTTHELSTGPWLPVRYVSHSQRVTSHSHPIKSL